MPNRDEILSNLGQSLAEINGSSRFWNKVSAVGSTLKTYDELGASEIPWLGYWPTETSPGPVAFPFGDELHTLEVQLIGVVNATLDTRTTALARLEQDIRTALYADRSRGGYAVDTRITGAPITDEGNPDKQGLNGSRATLTLVVQCIYFPDDP